MVGIVKKKTFLGGMRLRLIISDRLDAIANINTRISRKCHIYEYNDIATCNDERQRAILPLSLCHLARLRIVSTHSCMIVTISDF